VLISLSLKRGRRGPKTDILRRHPLHLQRSGEKKRPARRAGAVTAARRRGASGKTQSSEPT